LARRADQFLELNPQAAESVKRLFALRLAIVQPEGDPLRRRVSRDECGDEDWQLIQMLAGPDWRLVVTSIEDGESKAEVAHEVLLREWSTLAGWLEEQRDFLIWRTELERACAEWEARSDKRRNESLLSGGQLRNALHWLTIRSTDLPGRARAFIEASAKRKYQ